jgi:phosphoglycerate kinase
MANTFLAAQELDMGRSKVEKERLSVASDILSAAEARSVDVVLPEDLVVAESLDAAEGRIVAIDDVPPEMMALDIGTTTRERFGEVLSQAKTVFWNGPMGVFEKDAFAAGTVAVAEAVAKSGALSVVGGGDSVSAIHKAGVADRISHISTGGGASLEMMEGKLLPGIAALQ